jgi:glycosyltransferase involved in cell wall biosynthesis
VPPGEPAALADALAHALTDRDEARRRGAAARCDVREHRGVDAMTRRIEAFYRAGLGRAGREVTA